MEIRDQNGMPAAGLIFLILNTGKICNCYYHKKIFKINMTSIKILFLSVLFTLFFSGCNDQKNEKPKTENEGNKISDSFMRILRLSNLTIF